MQQSILSGILAMMVATVAGSAFGGQTWHVATNGSDSNSGTGWAQPWASISNAVTNAVAGDTILVAAGAYGVTEEIVVDKGVAILGLGEPGETIVERVGAQRNRIFRLLHPDSRVANLTIRNGYLSESTGQSGGGGALAGGAGIYMTGGMVSNCVITACSNIVGTPPTYLDYPFGGGVSMGGGTLWGCTVSSNLVFGYGGFGHGIYMTNGVVRDCVVIDNHGRSGDQRDGAGICMKTGRPLVTNTFVARNGGPGGTGVGGIAYNVGTVADCVIVSNNMPGIRLLAGLTLKGCEVAYNNGANVASRGNGCTITNCLIYGGAAGILFDNYSIYKADNNLVIDCVISNHSGSGITFSPANTNNRVIGSRVYYSSILLGNGAAANDNQVSLSGPDVSWDLGGKNIAVGLASSTNNVLSLDDGAVVDNVGQIGVTGAFNNVVLSGGLLGVVGIVYTNGLFNVGDGVQEATLKGLGGTLRFNNGLRIASRSALTGAGTVHGGDSGILLTNEALINPGLDGAGLLTLDGAGLDWSTGAVYTCDMVDVNLGAGIGWDLVNISTQLMLAAGPLTIQLDSLGSQAANFDPARDYAFRIVNYGTQVGFDSAIFMIDTNRMHGSTGPWSVVNQNKSLWLVYQGSGVAYSPSSRWNDPNNGYWDVAENWIPNGQPMNDGTAELEFGGSGTAYAATNNLGVFLLNKLLLTGTAGAAVTNLIGGDALVFSNDEARVDYSGSSSYLITNEIRSATNLVFGGQGYGGAVIVQTNLTVEGGLTKQGPWTLELRSPNTFSGPVLLDSVDGMLKVTTNRALGTANPLIVSNGTLWTATAGDYIFASAGGANRKGLITGAGTVWNNTGGAIFYLARGVSGVTLTLADGAFLNTAGKSFTMADSVANNTLVITNGARFVSSGANHYLASSGGANNNRVIITGTNSLWSVGGTLYLNQNNSGNLLRAERGGTITNVNPILANGSGSGTSLIITNGGRAYITGFRCQNFNNSNPGRAVVTGPGSLMAAAATTILYVGYRPGNADCSVTVDDGGTVSNGYWYITADINGKQNSIMATNGGRVFITGGPVVVGYTNGCVSNTVTICGSGSLWNNGGQNLIIAARNGTVFGNGVTVSDGGLLTNVATISLADVGVLSASDNFVNVSNGTVHANALICSNDRPNRVAVSGDSLVRIGRLSLNAAGQVFQHDGGSVWLANAWVSNGASQVVGDGSQPALLGALAGGTNVFADGLVVTNQAILAGVGTVASDTALFGQLCPGQEGIGALTHNGPLAFKGTAESRFELAAATGPGAGSDLLTVNDGTLTLAGRLKPVLVNGFVPERTDQFVIMTNSLPLGISGSFANGTWVNVYSNDLAHVVGAMRVTLTSQSVVLEGFAEIRPAGTVIVIQ